MRVHQGRLVVAIVVAFLGGAAAWLIPPGSEAAPAFPAPRKLPDWSPGSQPAAAARAELLRRARVWAPVDPGRGDLASNPPDESHLLSEPIVRCGYLPDSPHGTTAKFDCVLADGEVVKVKYGHTGEIPAELAASRLLAALGFGADRMYLVPKLRCYGCLRDPFYATWALDHVGVRAIVERAVPDDRFADFEWVAVERRFGGARVETDQIEGWAWFELDAIDPAFGANRAERDALRLAAMFLAHWDNKASNQRLVVRPDPFAYVHDLGATFGPNKLDLDAWSKAPIWTDRTTCKASMKGMPYGGGTFPDARISEAGRLLLARQLTALSERQVTALFTAARFGEFLGEPDVSGWTRAFREKVRQIVEAGPCE